MRPPPPPPTVTPGPSCLTAEIEPNNNQGLAGQLPPLCRNTLIEGALPSGDRDDYYRLEVWWTMNVSLALSSIPDGSNYDLYLYDSAGNLLDQSAEVGRSDEQIYLELPAGIYYARVYQRSGGSSRPYQLRWIL